MKKISLDTTKEVMDKDDFMFGYLLGYLKGSAQSDPWLAIYYELKGQRH